MSPVIDHSKLKQEPVWLDYRQTDTLTEVLVRIATIVNLALSVAAAWFSVRLPKILKTVCVPLIDPDLSSGDENEPSHDSLPPLPDEVNPALITFELNESAP